MNNLNGQRRDRTFTTIRRYGVKPGQMLATIERVRAGLVPIISKQQGFISYRVLDDGDNVAVSVTCYYSRATADAASAEAAAWAQRNLSRL